MNTIQLLRVKQFFILLIFCCYIHLAKAQTAQWIRQAGTSGITNGVSSDAAENCYATGTVSSPGLFDNLTVPSHFADVFIAKYNSSGIVQWAKTGGGELIDQGNEIVTDAAGNSYVAGSIQTNGVFPTVTFDNVTLTGNGSFDWFIAKYDANGNLLWAKNYGSTLGDFAYGVTLDPSGRVIVCGEFSASMTVEGTTVTSAGSSDVFVAKYETDGTLIWIKRAGGNGADIAHSVVTDASGNIAIAGEFQNAASFGTNSVSASGLGDAFIAKYDASGNNLWVRKGGGSVSFNIDKAYSITKDGQNNFYITGEFTGAGTFNGLTVTSNDPNYPDVFVAKYNSNGTIQWLHNGGGVHADKGYAVNADVNGNTFVTGFADSGPGVVFDTIELAPFGNEYIFLAKYNSSGDVLYVKQYAAGSGQDIHVLNNGCLYFGGGASKSNSGNEFDTIDLVYVDRGAFIGKFCDSPPVICQTPTQIHTNAVTSNSAKIIWSPVAGATSYLVQFRKQGSLNWHTKPATSNFKKLISLSPSTSYEYHVATVCGTSQSSYSTIQTFTTAPLKMGETIVDEPAVNVYPNPSHGECNIELDGWKYPVTLQIFDEAGRMIYQNEVGEASSLAKIIIPQSYVGFAFLTLKNAENIATKILVIE